MTAPIPSPPGRRVVIVGAGFGGLSAASALAKTGADVTLVDRRNHHLFQPLLYQVATAGLAPTQIASPIRMILGREPNVHIELDEVTGVDLANRRVQLGERAIAYDQLILATGATHGYFGRDEWATYAPGLARPRPAGPGVGRAGHGPSGPRAPAHLRGGGRRADGSRTGRRHRRADPPRARLRLPPHPRPTGADHPDR